MCGSSSAPPLRAARSGQGYLTLFGPRTIRRPSHRIEIRRKLRSRRPKYPGGILRSKVGNMVRGGRAVAVVLFAVLIAGVALGLVAPAASAGVHPHVAITDPAAGSTVRGTVTVAGNEWDVDGEIVKVLVGIDARDRT